MAKRPGINLVWREYEFIRRPCAPVLSRTAVWRPIPHNVIPVFEAFKTGVRSSTLRRAVPGPTAPSRRVVRRARVPGVAKHRQLSTMQEASHLRHVRHVRRRAAHLVHEASICRRRQRHLLAHPRYAIHKTLPSTRGACSTADCGSSQPKSGSTQV